MREDASKFFTVGVMGVGAGVEVYGHVWPEMRAMEGGVVVAEAVVAVCLRRRVVPAACSSGTLSATRH